MMSSYSNVRFVFANMRESDFWVFDSCCIPAAIYIFEVVDAA